jgi:hypothetical protein
MKEEITFSFPNPHTTGIFSTGTAMLVPGNVLFGNVTRQARWQDRPNYTVAVHCVQQCAPEGWGWAARDRKCVGQRAIARRNSLRRILVDGLQRR